MTPPASRSWDSRQKIFQLGEKIFAAAGPAGRPAADGAGQRGEGGGRRGERGRDGHGEEAPGGDSSHGQLSVCIHVKVSISAVIRHITDNLKLNFEKNKVVLGYPC